MRHRLVLTITLTGPECANRREEAASIHALGLCIGATQELLREIRDMHRVGQDVEIHHLQQQDDALWETVGREG